MIAPPTSNVPIFVPFGTEEMHGIVQAYPDRKSEFATALRALALALTPNPDKAGESREPPYRVFVHGQLAFWFRPAPNEDEAHVVWVHLREDRPASD